MKDDLAFDLEMAKEYDRGIRRALPTYDALFRIVQSYLRTHMPNDAELLVLGAGGGNEILTFGQGNPNWCFTGVDPSEEMLDVAYEKARQVGMEERVTIKPGTIETVELDHSFDGATCLLVLHFVEDMEDKCSLLEHVYKQLKPGAPFVLVTMYGDSSTEEFEHRLGLWKSIWLDLTSLDEEDVDAMAANVRELSFITEEEIEGLLKDAGFTHIAKFFSTTLFGGWIGRVPQ